jgi:hypothetical protein
MSGAEFLLADKLPNRYYQGHTWGVRNHRSCRFGLALKRDSEACRLAAFSCWTFFNGCGAVLPNGTTARMRPVHDRAIGDWKLRLYRQITSQASFAGSRTSPSRLHSSIPRLAPCMCRWRMRAAAGVDEARRLRLRRERGQLPVELAAISPEVSPRRRRIAPVPPSTKTRTACSSTTIRDSGSLVAPICSIHGDPIPGGRRSNPFLIRTDMQCSDTRGCNVGSRRARAIP